jgi:hypothetical protein
VTDLAPIAPRLANFIRLLASNRDGEVVAAARALVRTLQGIGADIHDVAARIEHSNGTLNEAEMQEIYDAGIKEGTRRVEQKMRSQAGHGAPTPQFPAPATMALYCYQRVDRLNEWEQEFATNMMNWVRHRSLYPKQRDKLEQLYIKLGGRI